MIFQLDHGYNSVAYPFKFNPACLMEESFGDLVQSEWSDIQFAVWLEHKEDFHRSYSN
jgi:hypothetical protein